MFSSRPIFINILASFGPLHRSRCPHRSLFESRNLLKILIKLDLEKSLNQFIEAIVSVIYAFYLENRQAYLAIKDDKEPIWEMSKKG